MGRKRKGSKRQRGSKWLASVPRIDHPTKRVECSFAGEAQADAWIDEQLDRLDRGLAPTRPQAETPSPTASPTASAARAADPTTTVRSGGPFATLREYAMAWHHEKYVALHGAQPERGDEVLRDLELHILPAFDGPIETDVSRGRQAVIEWTRRMAGYPPTHGETPVGSGRTYAKDTVSGLLWIYTEVLRYAHLLGADVRMVDGTPPMPALTCDIRALVPRGRKKRKPSLMTLPIAHQIAAQLNVVHQLVLWLMRIAGLRISEAYGLIVANFIDTGERCYLLIEAVGGRLFRELDDDENVRTTYRKDGTKTDAGYRLIALPGPLAALIRVVIRAAVGVCGTDLPYPAGALRAASGWDQGRSEMGDEVRNRSTACPLRGPTVPTYQRGFWPAAVLTRTPAARSWRTRARTRPSAA